LNLLLGRQPNYIEEDIYTQHKIAWYTKGKKTLLHMDFDINWNIKGINRRDNVAILITKSLFEAAEWFNK